jgi:membrane protein insertase Oxa1/YidC/SpoIIIJ
MIFNSAQRRGRDNKPSSYALRVHLNRKETAPMNKALLTILLLAFIVLFITSPFAALAMLMFVVLGGAFISAFWNLLQALIGNAPKEPL